MVQKETTFSLKDQLFNKESVNHLADLFVGVYPEFDKLGFVVDSLEKFPDLGLKERISWLCEQLYLYLPSRYENALEIILQALPPELDPTKNDNDFGEFILSPLATYVHTYGCSEKYFDISRQALQELTKRFSVEFSIRKFINTFPEKMYEECKKLALSKNYHQRRLVSEGSRITLPWAENITRTPRQVIPLLDLLYADPTRYVTRSVANNMNGLSKTDPDLVFATLTHRKKSRVQQEKEMDYIIKHSLRTLLKQGNTQAMRMLGYGSPDHIEITSFEVDSDVMLGGSLDFSCNFYAQRPLGKCRIDYAIGYMKANGTIAEKVFKLAETTIQQQEISYKKSHSFKPMTTRKHYTGKHTITLIVNGKRFETKSFLLTV